MFREFGYLIRSNGWFLLPWFLGLLGVTAWLVITGKTNAFLAINGAHNPGADIFFKYTTWLGDGIFYAVIVVVLLFLRFRWAVTATAAFILTSVVTQTLKRTVFSGESRPKGLLDLDLIQTVDGVEIFSKNAFPSGHTTTAFSVFLVLAIIGKSKPLGLLWFALAVLAGWSRIYLGQHFLEDVLAGSLVGVFFTLLIASILNTMKWGKWSTKSIILPILSQKKRAEPGE